jgi:hypothetical protein
MKGPVRPRQSENAQWPSTIPTSDIGDGNSPPRAKARAKWVVQAHGTQPGLGQELGERLPENLESGQALVIFLAGRKAGRDDEHVKTSASLVLGTTSYGPVHGAIVPAARSTR